MKTQFITLQVSLRVPPNELRAALPGSDMFRSDALRSHIESQLSTHGSPLRWSITHVDLESQTAHVEAVVTQLPEPAVPSDLPPS
ncbi:MAG: hypothetical protein AAFU53_10210 [Cyanobacteria bacterium J06632_3]